MLGTLSILFRGTGPGSSITARHSLLVGRPRSRVRKLDWAGKILQSDPAPRVLDDSFTAKPLTLSLASGVDRPRRLDSIDAVRGTAMLFVFLAHFTGIYLWRTGARELASYLSLVSMIASPTFVAVSGMLVGFFSATNPQGFQELRIKLLDRGLFLLILGHLLLAITVTPASTTFAAAYRTSFITDAIALSIVIAPSLLKLFGLWSRSAFALSLFVLNWLAIIEWHPLGVGLLFLKRYFVGMQRDPSREDSLG